MRNLLSTLAGVALLAAATASAEEAPAVSFTLDAGLSGNYVWRGVNIVDDPVFQYDGILGTSIGGGDLSLTVWGNMDITNVNKNMYETTEVDYTLAYAYKVADDNVKFSVGAIAYTYPAGNVDNYNSSEVFVGAELSKLPVVPSVTVYNDFEEAHGTYVSSALAYSYAIPDTSLSLSTKASVGWGNSNHNEFVYYGTMEDGWTDFLLTVGLPFAVTGKLTITPAVNYSSLIDSELRTAARDNDKTPDNVWGSLTATYTF